MSFIFIHFHSPPSTYPPSFTFIHFYPPSFTFIHFHHPSQLCGSRKYPYPPPTPHGRSLEIPKVRGGSKAIISKGGGGSWETSFPKGDKATINLKQKNILTYIVLKQKSVLLAIKMRVNILSFNVSFFL